MQYLTCILIGLLGVWLGRKMAIKRCANRIKLERMGEKGRETIGQKTTERKNKIFQYAREKGRITNNDIETKFKISGATAERYLNQLEKEGKLTQIGETGKDVYCLPTNGSNA